MKKYRVYSGGYGHGKSRISEIIAKIMGAKFIKLRKKDIRGNYKLNVKKGSLPIE